MIRSLSNGLEVLIFLNRKDSASASELAKELNIPRASVYRILSTLEKKGFVFKHPDDGRYYMTPKVHALSDGYKDDDQLTRISRPFLLHVTESLRWPVALAVISGVDLVLRDNTDNISPLAIETFSRGYPVQILGTASGPCILAYLSSTEQRDILNVLDASDRLKDQTEKNIEQILQKLKTVKRQGYSLHRRKRNKNYVGYTRVSDLTSLSIPIIKMDKKVIGALTIRYATSAVSNETALEEFKPVMMEAVSGIASQIDQSKDNV